MNALDFVGFPLESRRYNGRWAVDGIKRTKWRTGSFEALDAGEPVSLQLFCAKDDMPTEGPLRRVHKYSKIFVCEAVCVLVRASDMGRIKRERGVELDLALNCEVMKGSQ